MHPAIIRIAKTWLWNLSPVAYRRFTRKPRLQYSVGIYSGPDLLHLSDAPGVTNPVLTGESITDVPAGSVADPFLHRVDGRWYLFVEIVNQLSRKGEIAVAVSSDGRRWTYDRLVLAEPFHLSYPQVFEHNGEHYMIPESGQVKAVRLYKSAQFPYEWQFVGNLLEGSRFVDSSIIRYRDRWWLFCDAGESLTEPELRLYSAEDLRGQWQEHPASPVVTGNQLIARPSGRIAIIGGKLVRFTQGTNPYGTEVRAFEIIELTETGYRERQIGEGPILEAGEQEWNAAGMHHIDAHSVGDLLFCCVDGRRQPQ